MKNRKIRIGFIYQNTGGVGRYRIINPATLIEERDNDFEVRIMHESITNRDLEWMDIFVLQRLGDPWVLDVIDYVHKNGGKVVYDIDDYIESIPMWNPAQRYLHRGNKRYETIKEALKKSDLVTTTTEFLKNWLIGEGETEPYNKNVKIMPNYQSMKRIRKEQAMCGNRWEKDENTVRIVWHGSKHHQGDLSAILIPMIHILEKFDNVEFIMFGSPNRDFLASLPFEKVFFLGEVLYDWFYRTLWMINGDIALCPLLDVKFNYGKSDIKIAESAISGMVSVASNISTFQNLVENGEDGHLVENKEIYWISAISDLINHKEKRVSMQKKMEEKIEQKYNLDKKIVEYEKIYRSLLQ